MICKLRPACKSYIWGGRRLIEEYGKGDGAGNLAESWELSCHPDGPSIAADGPYTGRSLPEILAERPELAGRAVESLGRFPVLVKLIDAARDLSVQVHPDDAYALKHEGQLGKTEMWYIIYAEPGAGLYCGFRREVTPAQLHTAIEGNTLCELLRRVPVKAGDVVFIPAGTVHAIGAGILLAEIQQSSSVTTGSTTTAAWARTGSRASCTSTRRWTLPRSRPRRRASASAATWATAAISPPTCLPVPGRQSCTRERIPSCTCL